MVIVVIVTMIVVVVIIIVIVTVIVIIVIILSRAPARRSGRDGSIVEHFVAEVCDGRASANRVPAANDSGQGSNCSTTPRAALQPGSLAGHPAEQFRTSGVIDLG